MANNSYTLKSVTAPGGANNIQLFQADQRRVTLCIAAITAATVTVYSKSSTVFLSYDFIFSSPGLIVLPYRDFGDYIRQEIWINSSVGGMQVNGISVFLIG